LAYLVGPLFRSIAIQHIANIYSLNLSSAADRKDILVVTLTWPMNPTQLQQGQTTYSSDLLALFRSGAKKMTDWFQ
jgi:hypothetical protein